MNNYRINTDATTAHEIMQDHVVGFIELEETSGPAPRGNARRDRLDPRPVGLDPSTGPVEPGPPPSNSGHRFLLLVGTKSIRIPDTEFPAWEQDWNTIRGNRSTVELPGVQRRANSGRFGSEPIKRYVFLLDQVHSYEITGQGITIDVAGIQEIDVDDRAARQKFLDAIGAA